MGLFDFITNIFSKSGKKKAVKRSAKKVAGKKKGLKLKAAPSPQKTKKKTSKSKANADVQLKVKNTKKRKKSQKIKAAPIDEKSLGFSISLKDDAELSRKRDALRIRVKGLTAYVHRLNKKFAVTDISATGLGFKFEKPRIKGGVKLMMDLYMGNEVQTEGIECKVMRHDRGSVGCVFVELDRKQDDTVHALVLKGQKEQAERRAAQKDADFSIPK